MSFSVLSVVSSLLVISPVAWGALDDMVWEIDWNNYDEFDLETFEPFSSPGVIVDGYTFDDTMKLVEMTWQASSPQEVIGLLCVKYGPTIYGFANAEDQYSYSYSFFTLSSTIESLRETCDDVVASLKWGTISNIKGSCITAWNLMNQLDLAIDENNTLFTLEECYHTNSFDGDKFQYAMDIMAGVYSSCSGYGLGTDRISALAFGALNWLGPPLLYVAPFDDPLKISFGACSLLRYALSMDLNDILNHITTLMSYPIADALEYFQYLQICSKLGENVHHSEGFNLIFDLLLTFSGETSTSLCEFFSTENTRQMYMEEAEYIVDGMMSAFTDTTVCQQVLAEVSTSDDAITFLGAVTGRDNLNNVAGRRTLCNDITSALATSSADSLQSYTLPGDVDINEYEFLSVPGELLPNFRFADLLKFVGAISASETATDAVEVYCDVFEDFLVSNEIFYGVNVEELCSFVRQDDLGNIETFCVVTAFSTLEYDEEYPLALRTMDPLMVGGDMLRRLIQLNRFGQEELCSTIDNFVIHSSHNLRSIASFAISAYLKEGLPSARGICQDWNDIICFLGPSCGDTSNFGRERQQNYLDLVEKLEELFLLALGYDSRFALCDDIEDGIETLSGRATDDVVEDMTAKILFVLENSERCTEVADALLKFASSEMESDNTEITSEYILYMVTGYNTTAEVCDVVAATFPSHGLPRNQISLLLTVISLLAAILTPH